MNENKIHKTREGETLLIAEMDDNHLSNTIKVFCKRIAQFSSLLAKITNSSTHFAEDFLTGKDNIYSHVSKKKIKVELEDSENRLRKYLLEASIRGLDFHQVVSDAYGRNKAIDDGIRSFTEIMRPKARLSKELIEFDEMEDRMIEDSGVFDEHLDDENL